MTEQRSKMTQKGSCGQGKRLSLSAVLPGTVQTGWLILSLGPNATLDMIWSLAAVDLVMNQEGKPAESVGS